MIKSYNMILNEYVHYKSPKDKIKNLLKEGKIIKLTKGLYETDKKISSYLVANAIYGPSYLSFEFALSYHGLIPEAVYTYTSATFKRKKEKKYINYFGTFTYKDIPANAYPFEILVMKEDTYQYKIASAEKALCDKLYAMKPVKNKQEIIFLMFKELRIDEAKFHNLNKEILLELIDMYPSTNLKMLKKVIKQIL